MTSRLLELVVVMGAAGVALIIADWVAGKIISYERKHRS